MSILPANHPAAADQPSAVLVVDDDPVTGRLISGALEARDIGPVVTVHTLAEAGRAIATTRFAAAVVDLHLPDGNGMEFVHLARRGQNSRNHALTIIVCSAYAGEATTELLRRLGADEILTKPPDVEALVTRLMPAVIDIAPFDDG